MATRTPAPLHATPRTRRPTIGPAIGDVARKLGTPLMPWQQRVADVSGELNPDGSFAHPDVLLSVPRQAGKSGLSNARLIHGLSALDSLVAVYYAQNGPAGRRWWRRLDQTLSRSPYAAMYHQRKALGDELLTWGPTSSTVAMLPPTESAGHGDTLDLALADEIWRQVDFRLPQAITPAMITRPNGQRWWISTAGTPDSALFLSLLDQARATCADPDALMALFEWGIWSSITAETCPCGRDHEDRDPTKRSSWRAANPAVGFTQSIDAVAAAYKTMELDDFRRAFLNQWIAARIDRVITMDLWLPNQVTQSPLTPGAPLWLAFDVAPARDGAAIVSAGQLEGGTIGLELVDYLTNPFAVTARVLELVDRHRPVKVLADAAGPAGTVIDALAPRLGERLEVLNGRGYARACQSFYDDLGNVALRVTNAAELDTAAGSAVRRPLGDGWAWGRARSSGDISPLVAATLAAYGVRLHRPSAGPRVYSRT